MTLEQLLALVSQAMDADALAGMDREQAQALADQLLSGYNEFKPTVTDAAGVEALRQVVEALAAANGRVEAIDGEASDVEAAIAELDQQVAAATAEPEPEPEAETTEPEPEETTAEAEPTEEEARQAASAGTRAPDLDALGRTPAPQRRTEPESPQTRIVASASFPGAVAAGSDVTLAQLGEAFARGHKSMQTLTRRDLPFYDQGITSGGRKTVLATIPIIDRPGVVHLQDGDNSEKIDQAVREFVANRDERLATNQRRVASGGDCVMALPDFSIDLIGEPGTCFTDDLPTVAGNRPLTYYPWFKINQSSAPGTDHGVRPDQGIGFVTSEQDAAGYGDPDITLGDPGAVPTGGVPYKECIHIDCPDDPLTCSQEAVYKCVTFGNFQAISHPEYVSVWQRYIDIWFDIERDTRALDSFIAEATAQSHMLTATEQDFGAIASLKDVFHRLLAHERSARHSPNLSLNVVAPDWFAGFLSLDVMLHSFGSIDNLRATPSQAMALASTDGIRMSTYCTETWGSGSGHVEQVLTPIAAGAVPDWPAKARLLLYPDGAVFKKTAGELEIGLRETLMKTNDFGGFNEIFEKVCYRGDVYVLDVALCANGATGAPVAITCP